MIDHIFSGDFIKKIFADKTREIGNIDPDLDGLIVAGISSLSNRDILWIVNENSDLEELRAKLLLWLDMLENKVEVILLPLPSRDPYFNDNVTQLYKNEKLKLFESYLSDKTKIIISTPLSVSVKLESPEEFKENRITLTQNQNMNRDKFILSLLGKNYSHENWVESPGEFRKRGGIVELFPVGHMNPVRIEFFGNRVESVTVFHRTSRYSLNEIDEITIPSCKNFGSDLRFEDIFKIRHGKTILKLLKNPRVVFSDKDVVYGISERYIENFSKIFRINVGKVNLPKPQDIFKPVKTSIDSLNIRRFYDDISGNIELKKLKKNIRQFSVEDLKKLKNDSREKTKVYILSTISVLSENLRQGGVWFKGINKIIPCSFENRVLGTLFLTDKEFVFKHHDSFSEEIFDKDRIMGSFSKGDYIVHSLHGIGKFMGTSILKIGKVEQEFIKLEYSGGGILYVPVYEANILSKYHSFKGIPPKMDRIGGKSWNNKKSRAKKSILIFAKELLDLYAKRSSIKGFSYSGDRDLELKLSETFEFVETPDQKKAIEDVMSDLEKHYPMERLICGDVSFGKTEVAIRGALRVVLNGKQVAVLCPTTILAMQHYQTFKKRLNDFPIRIEMLSRMVLKRKEREILQCLKDGKVDILIGTHSLLSGKTEFKNLGMYIIDEEQRFGVFQKEKLKKGRENIDVLSLSATPIPRTLSMSMAGLQDISVIKTPPLGRLGVKNYIGPFFREKVVSAVLNEIERGGAVFVVYNSVEKIFSFKKILEEWMPDIPIAVIHAKMSNREIERNLMSFIDGEYSVLLSTTIIENGIDISHVNTLIVVEAENYGLTQLYQLRGRIGRSSRQAYAYFFTKSPVVTDKARMRLDGIRDHSGIGAGFDLAELDLRLRGAGSLLGNRQHGHIEALGFDYYNSLLKKTIAELKGESTKEWKGKIDINFIYSIDKKVIENMSDRMDMYKTISSASSLKELDRFKNETETRYGRSGNIFEKLFLVGKAKYIAAKYCCKSVYLETDKVVFDFGDKDVSLMTFDDSFYNKYNPNFEGTEKISFSFNDFNMFFHELENVLDKNFKITG